MIVQMWHYLNFKQTQAMSVQEFFDRVSDLSLKALVVEGVSYTIANENRQTLLHSILLGNLVPEIRRGELLPKTPKLLRIYSVALLEEKALTPSTPMAF